MKNLDVNGRPVITMGQLLTCTETGKQFIAARDGCSVNYAWGRNNEIFSDEGVDIREKREMSDRSKPFFCYLSCDGRTVGGWKSNVLGRVVSLSRGRVGFARSGCYVQVVDIHGAKWHGKNAGPGMCIKLQPSKGKKMKTHYGMMAACKYCDQDIQFLGGHKNWRDRGANRSCAAYLDKAKGEYVTPKTKHAPYKEGVTK